MTTQRYEASAILNNQGVEAINAGDLGRACELLVRALHSVRGSLESTAAADRDDPPTPTITSRPSCPVITSERCTATGSTPLSPPSSNTSGEHSSMFLVYSMGVPIEMPSDRNAMDLDCRVYSGTIIFNLALVHHLKGLLGSTKVQQQALHNAMSLYEKCYVLVIGFLHELSHETNLDHVRAGRSSVRLLTMALLNNMVHLSWEFMNYHQSQDTFYALIEFALSSSSSSSSSYEDPHTSSNTNAVEELKQSFLLNAMIHHNRAPIAAAA
jgi:hypothetical protein